MSFTHRHKQILAALCNTIVPSLEAPQEPADFWQRKASDLHIHELLLSIMETQDTQSRNDFKQMLSLFDSRLFMGAATGFFAPFDQLAPDKQEQVLQKFAVSRFALLRQIFSVIKKLTAFLYYSYAPDAPNPNWQPTGYPGPLSPPPAISRPITPLEITGDTVLDCDILVIGSGAGGGVVAGELSKAGHRVIVVEKGPYLAEDAFTQKELDMNAQLLENRGMLSTRDASVNIYAGSCLGGGTTVNWAGALVTPDFVLEEWAQQAGLPHLLSAEYREGFSEVAKTIHVNLEEVVHNPQNQILWEGSSRLGHLLKVMPRNVKGCIKNNCHYCSYCPMGCQLGNKQSTVKTYLQEAYDRGTIILANTQVERISIAQGRATGAEAQYRSASGQLHRVQIKAKKVVVSAGALHSPVLLMRSGLKHPAIGSHLYLHPTVAVAARYPQVINPWFGTMMSVINDQFNRLNGNYGVKIETPPVHLGLIAVGTPWPSGQAHKEAMLRAAHVANFVVITRDRDGGRIRQGKYGQLLIDYKISDFDLKHLLRGMEEAVYIHQAAGAEEVYLPHHQYQAFRTDRKRKVDHVRYIIEQRKWDPNYFALFSAHQMGTCRMGSNARTHATRPDGQTYEVKDLYVADASLFPAASGVNPMLSIQAMAYWVARGLK